MKFANVYCYGILVQHGQTLERSKCGEIEAVEIPAKEAQRRAVAL
jgi:hypothetical protein